MSDADLQYLLDMGFSDQKCKRALKVSNNVLQEALEWLLVHGMEPDTDQASLIVDCNPTENATLKLSAAPQTSADKPVEEEQTSSEASAGSSANSLKCDDCGMLLKDEDFATLHAHKTAHVNFSQSTETIKPKTKEEIEEQKKRLGEKLVKLREEKAKKEKEEEIIREMARRKEGRQINEIKQKFHEDELRRIGEEKRREKIADAEYKKKLKEQISADREAMKRQREAEASGKAPAPAPVAAPQLVQNEKREYTDCRIQIRLTDGKSLQHTFKAKDQLACVRLWVELNRTDGAGKFNIMQTFPRKVYTEDDMMLTLADLGLVPASSLVVTKI